MNHFDTTSIVVMAIVIFSFVILYITYLFDLQRNLNDDYYDDPL